MSSFKKEIVQLMNDMGKYTDTATEKIPPEFKDRIVKLGREYIPDYFISDKDQKLLNSEKLSILSAFFENTSCGLEEIRQTDILPAHCCDVAEITLVALLDWITYEEEEE